MDQVLEQGRSEQLSGRGCYREPRCPEPYDHTTFTKCRLREPQRDKVLEQREVGQRVRPRLLDEGRDGLECRVLPPPRAQLPLKKLENY